MKASWLRISLSGRNTPGRLSTAARAQNMLGVSMDHMTDISRGFRGSATLLAGGEFPDGKECPEGKRKKRSAPGHEVES